MPVARYEPARKPDTRQTYFKRLRGEMITELSPDLIHQLYAWIDVLPLNRPKRNITRDFSDGVACAEVIKHYMPKLVEIHNYSPANGIAQKLYNWNTLIAKVTKKFGYIPSDELVQGIVNNRNGFIEVLLWELREKLYDSLAKKGSVPPELMFSENPTQDQTSAVQGQLQQQQYYNPGVMPPNPSFLGNPYASPTSATTQPQMFGDFQQNLYMQQSGGHQGLDKDHLIGELQETVGILQLKIDKLEQLLTLKTKHIDELEATLASIQHP